MSTEAWITSFGFLDDAEFGSTAAAVAARESTRLKWKDFSTRPYDRFRKLDPLSRCAMVATELLALPLPEDGGLGDETAVVLGTAFGSLAVDTAFYASTAESNFGSPALFKNTLPNIAAGEVTARFGIKGPSLTLLAGADSGALALAEAIMILDEQEATTVVCLAADAVDEASTPVARQATFGLPGHSCLAYAFLVETPRAAEARGRTRLASVALSAETRGTPEEGIEAMRALCCFLNSPATEPDAEELLIANQRGGNRANVIVASRVATTSSP